MSYRTDTLNPELYKQNAAINGATRHILENIPGAQLERLTNITYHKLMLPSPESTEFRKGELRTESGINVEEGELLYGLVRAFKPLVMLETGTNIGISAMYAALAMKDNGFGKLLTIEGYKDIVPVAQHYFDLVGVSEQVQIIQSMTEDFELNQEVDFIWLDAKLESRYEEFVRFYPNLSNGGIVCIHDHSAFGDNPGFGTVPELMQTLHRIEVKSGAGVTFFQKRLEGIAPASRMYHGVNT